MSDNKDQAKGEKSVDISLDMKQVAIAAFATGLIIGVIITGTIFVLTNVSEDINQGENTEEISAEPVSLEISQNYNIDKEEVELTRKENVFIAQQSIA